MEDERRRSPDNAYDLRGDDPRYRTSDDGGRGRGRGHYDRGRGRGFDRGGRGRGNNTRGQNWGKEQTGRIASRQSWSLHDNYEHDRGRSREERDRRNDYGDYDDRGSQYDNRRGMGDHDYRYKSRAGERQSFRERQHKKRSLSRDRSQSPSDVTPCHTSRRASHSASRSPKRVKNDKSGSRGREKDETGFSSKGANERVSVNTINFN